MADYAFISVERTHSIVIPLERVPDTVDDSCMDALRNFCGGAG
jgi:hypothetical protein